MKGLKIVLVLLGILTLAKSLLGIFAPWSELLRWSALFGYPGLPTNPLMIYTVRLASLMFAMVGIFFFVLATDPMRYRPLIGLSVWGLLLLAAGAVVAGVLLRLHPAMYLAGALSLVVAALLLVVFWPRSAPRQATA